MRTPQQIGKKGSLKWLQLLINKYPKILNEELNSKLNFDSSSIEWVSPKEEDEYAEYRDKAFLNVLGLGAYQNKLKEFWSKSGPQWDALGKLGSKQYLLLEAKANIPEIVSSCQAKNPKSLEKIDSSIRKTKDFLGVKDGSGWTQGYYQYSNRLCHLFFLREMCGLDAYLIFLYFCNDKTHISTSKEEWKIALDNQKKIMALNSLLTDINVVDIFVNTEKIMIEPVV